MAIKRIKKMILGLFCLISSTSALAYNFLPAYAPALVVEKPRAERAQPVVETPVAAAIAIPASQTGLTPVQPARTAAVAAS